MPQTYYTAQPDPGESFRCRHVYMDGHRCAAPCLRGQQLCYQHHATRRPIQDAAAHKARLGTFEFPGPDQLADRSGILHAIALVLERIASNDLDPRRAGLLLYGLQTAVIALPKPPLNAEPPSSSKRSPKPTTTAPCASPSWDDRTSVNPRCSTNSLVRSVRSCTTCQVRRVTPSTRWSRPTWG